MVDFNNKIKVSAVSDIPFVNPAINKAQHDLPALINKWQTKLKLNHWKIDYEFCDREKIGIDCHAKCQMHLANLRAEILFITEDEFNKGQKEAFIKEPYDLEHTVIHEMCHILLRPLQVKDDEVEEQCVNILTRIIHEQDRKERQHVVGKI